MHLQSKPVYKVIELVRSAAQNICTRFYTPLDNSFALSIDGIDRANQQIQEDLDSRVKKIKREYFYNKELSHELSAELFDTADKHIVVYDTQMEVCDVFIPENKVFIHSKIRRGPDSLSHLFTQGIVISQFSTSTRLYCLAIDFKDKISRGSSITFESQFSVERRNLR